MLVGTRAAAAAAKPLPALQGLVGRRAAVPPQAACSQGARSR